jgi:hypothetical protein
MFCYELYILRDITATSLYHCADFCSFRHVGQASPGSREASRPSGKSSLLESCRELRKSRLRPWFSNGSMGDPRLSVDNSTAASRLQDNTARIQAHKADMDAIIARSQARRLARAQDSQAKSQATRQPARSQATTRTAPEKAITPQARSQATRQPARSQASTKAAPVTASRLRPLGDLKARVVAVTTDRAMANGRGSDDAFASKAAKPRTVATAHRPDPKLAEHKAPPVRPARRPSPASPTISSGERLDSKTRCGAGVSVVSPEVPVPKFKPVPSPVDDSPSFADLFEEIAREGPVRPASTIRKTSRASPTIPSGEQLSSKTRRGAGVAAASPEVSVPTGRPAPSPVDDLSLFAGLYEEIAREALEEQSSMRKMSRKCGGGPKALTVDHRAPAHRSLAPARPALRNGSSGDRTVNRKISWNDKPTVRIVSRWMDPVLKDLLPKGW